jgi:cytochrome P450
VAQHLEVIIRQLAIALIDQVIEKRECEFTTDYGRPLPVSIFLDLMGLPQDMRDTFVTCKAVDLLHSQSRETMGGDEIDHGLSQAGNRGANRQPGRWRDQLHCARGPGGEPLTAQEIFGYVAPVHGGPTRCSRR